MFDWLYWIFAKILSGIDWTVYHLFNIHNTGLCIVLFTIVVYLLMYPLNSKQQKSSRLMAKINPEIKEIQKKYKNKKDQASQMKMNQETQEVYAKYGISPFGGCLPLLITLPIMYCLYRVMYNITTYVPSLSDAKASIFLGLDVEKSPLALFHDRGNYPYAGYLAFIIPILAVVFQFINSKMLQPKDNKSKQEEDSMAQSMKMMNYFMPLMSGFFCLSLNIGIGLYWITGSIFRIVQAFFINRKVDKISLEELIEKNKDKASKKNAKREQMNRQMEEYSKRKTASIKTATSYQNKEASSEKSSSSENVTVNKDIEPGSIAGYAHMLSGKKDK
ncbi:MAG: YidC/Oxa1 family membrane protein insertase [Lachnospiraceae bacterium]|nr:YidC/Oxa1 family membrane protein insertase [Lachnospiraceae bacterium]